LQKFFDAAPRGTSDVESLHRFRIRSKRLRYAMELLAPAFPPTFREEIYPVVESLQNRLGEVNDSRTVCEFLEARLSGTSDPEQVEAQRALLTAWESRLERARAEFFDWWTPRRADDLGAAFEEMLADREETAGDIGYTERGNDE
jgi:CHAD domain-containing protein